MILVSARLQACAHAIEVAGVEFHWCIFGPASSVVWWMISSNRKIMEWRPSFDTFGLYELFMSGGRMSNVSLLV
jgi:hypothetical protein